MGEGWEGAMAPVPLVVALHPLGSSSAAFVKWWGLEPLADEKTFRSEERRVGKECVQ